MTPSPMPGAGASPLMTWGCIGGTPLILDPSDRCTEVNSVAHLTSTGYVRSLLSDARGGGDYNAVMYQPPPVQQRELLAHAMVAKEKSRKAGVKGDSGAASTRNNSSSSTAIGSHSSSLRHAQASSSSSRHSQLHHRHQLTPAAMSLAVRLSGSGSFDALGSDALSQSYSVGHGHGALSSSHSSSSRRREHSKSHGASTRTDLQSSQPRGPRSSYGSSSSSSSGSSSSREHHSGMNTDNLLNL